MDESIQVSCIIDKLPLSSKDFKHTLKHLKEELTLIELGSHLHTKESLRVKKSDKPKGNNVAGPLVVNMVEHNNSSRYNDNKGTRKHHDTIANPNKKPKVICWKCGKPGHLKRITKLEEEVTLIVVDSSQYMRSEASLGAYPNQLAAIDLYCDAKLQSNPKNAIGLYTMGGIGLHISYLEPTSDVDKIMAHLNKGA
nr:zinc finger, CCHC-type [Tanacetum cinerariifolium]